MILIPNHESDANEEKSKSALAFFDRLLRLFLDVLELLDDLCLALVSDDLKLIDAETILVLKPFLIIIAMYYC